LGVGGRKRIKERKREMVGITARGKRVGSWGRKKTKVIEKERSPSSEVDEL
jgi:hypothetical protein